MGLEFPGSRIFFPLQGKKFLKREFSGNSQLSGKCDVINVCGHVVWP